MSNKGRRNTENVKLLVKKVRRNTENELCQMYVKLNILQAREMLNYENSLKYDNEI